MNTLYTYGYSGGSDRDLLLFAKEHDALVVDVRFKPFSRFTPQWNQRNLRDTLRDHYYHLLELGNRNYKGENGSASDFVNLEHGLANLAQLLETRPVILLCVCKDVNVCHRKEIATIAAERFEVEVIHLNKTLAPSSPPPTQGALF